MSLFHPRVLERNLKHVPKLSASQSDILESWAENLSNHIFEVETQHDGEFIQRILIDVLGYTGSIEGSVWTVAKNEPVGKGNVDVALGKFSADGREIIAPFELKGTKTKNLDAVMSGRNKSPVQQAWEYAMDAKGAEWVLVSNYHEIRLYAVGYGRKDYEVFNLSKLECDEELSKFMLLLSADNLLSGKTLQLLKESEQVDKDITTQLYSDYKELRSSLIETIAQDNPDSDRLSIIGFTQTILDRILFIAFAEDKGLIPKNTLQQAYETTNHYNPLPVWDTFKGLFNAINVGNSNLNIPAYNGGLFAENKGLESLKVSNELCEGFKKIGDYDFDSDVRVNILGHIFEQSISDIEELKAKTGDLKNTNTKNSKRKDDGIFYTPPHITRYIVDSAVGGWLSKSKLELGIFDLPDLSDKDYASIKSSKRTGKITYGKKIEKHIQAWEAYLKALSNIKVLDPACGSGAFLNEVFDYLKTEGEMVNRELDTLKGSQSTLFEWDTHILANNIFGVDLNSESVEITKLSLWLKTANKQEKLTYLEDNIRVGDSLIDDPDIAAALAFDWRNEFAEIMDNGGFDVIVGNPPYVVLSSKKDTQFNYLQDRYDTAFGRLNTFALFIEKCTEIVNKKQSEISLIIPDSLCLIDYYSKLRKFILDETNITEIIQLGDGIFSDATVPAVVFSFNYPKKKGNIVQIGDAINLENRTERAHLVQDSFYDMPKESFNLHVDDLFLKVNKLKEKRSFFKLSEIIEIRIGICTGGNKKHLSPELIYKNPKKVLQGKDINRYKLVWNGMYVNYSKEELLRSRDETIFLKKPKLFMRQTSDSLILCFDDTQYYAIDSLFIVYPKNDSINLKYLLCLMNSKLLNRQYQILNYESGRVFPQVKIDYVNELVIMCPDKKTQDVFADLADKTIYLVESITNITTGLYTLIKAEFNLESTRNRKLDNFYELDAPTFSKELQKLIKPQKLSLTGKSEWIEYFEKEKNKAIDLNHKIDEVNKQIDEHVYELYGLTPDEIKLVEQK